MTSKMKYGKNALVAGGSEGLGAAFAYHLAAQGMNLFLVARRAENLKAISIDIEKKHKVEVVCISCDLSSADAVDQIIKQLGGKEIDFLVYNAALSFIGAFENNSIEDNNNIAHANMITPMNLVQRLAIPMLQRGRGGIVLMASLAGLQGSGFLSLYAATKAFNRIFAESLWYEWKDSGVDVIACVAGATSTPNFIKSKPGKSSFFAPRVQSPEEVVKECFSKLGKTPSTITGRGNKIASFIMQRLMPRKMSIKIMGDTTRKMYGL